MNLFKFLLRYLTAVTSGFTCYAFAAIATPSADVSQFDFINLTEDFDVFWNANKESSSQVQLKNFKSSVAKKFPDFYDYKFEQWQKAGENPQEKLREQLIAYQNYRLRFLEIAKFLPEYLIRASKPFKNVFPDFSKRVQTYVIHSLDEMDGGTRVLNKRLFFIFGAESIAQYHQKFDYESKSPFLHHELFHIYHKDYFTTQNELIDGLWSEGMAVLVAETMNPNATIAQLSLDNPKGLMETCHRLEYRLLSDIQSRLKNPSIDDYETYFWGSSKHTWIPKRAGYCIGYELAKAVNRNKLITDMAKMNGSSVAILLNEMIATRISELTKKESRHDGTLFQ